MDKQIEEMQLVMLNTFDLLYFNAADVKANSEKRYLAESRALYSAGWRKAQKGEWVPASTKPGVYAGMKCSLCKARITYSEYYNKQHLYCHKCGARMNNPED